MKNRANSESSKYSKFSTTCVAAANVSFVLVEGTSQVLWTPLLPEADVPPNTL